nr:aminopeptidase [Candidatus Njordarchaeota archaeon]
MSIEGLPICSRNEVSEFLEDELLPKWQKGNPTLFRIEPEHVDARIEKTVESVIANNGTYVTGERVAINSRPDALPMAAEIGNVLEKLGHKTCIIYDLLGDPPSLNKLMTGLPNRKSLEQVVGQYEALVDFAQHWMRPYATPHSEPNRKEKEAVVAFTEVVMKGISKLNEKREKGEIKSQDVIGFPVEHEAKRLGLSLSEWEPVLYRAMGITRNELDKEIDKTGYVKVLGEAYAGKTLRIVRKGDYVVNLTMKVKDRPIFKDVGRVGYNTICGKYFERITNIPPGEICMAPVEDSVNGEFYTKIPQVTERGKMEGVHIVFRNGRVVKATADKGEEVLCYYTGLAKPETTAKKAVYEGQNTIAELGIGMNPVLDFEKVTGNPLIDEKMKGIHIATGTNIMLGGKTPGAIGGIAVDHWDFMVGKIDEIITL